MPGDKTVRIAELFAGVGGFRLGLDGYQDSRYPHFHLPPAGPFHTVWANQWEPPGSLARQFAARCYEDRFGPGSVINRDIHEVLDDFEAGKIEIPDVDMVVGGFPCQDYSVAKSLSDSHGIEGKKGVLWWEIYRFLELQQPRFVLLENVDRLLKSPATQRGRDFAIMLACLAALGYVAQWRVVNSGEYGFPQRRKRVYIFACRQAAAGSEFAAAKLSGVAPRAGEEYRAAAQKLAAELEEKDAQLVDVALGGVLARAFPIHVPPACKFFDLPKDIVSVSQNFGRGLKTSPFEAGGVMREGRVCTFAALENYTGERLTLGDVLVPEEEVPASFYIAPEKEAEWQYLKGAKREERVDKKTGFKYFYSEGSMAFPDALDRPSRTILTGEGGAGASRFKHVIRTSAGRLRRLVPDELDRLQGFPRGWTDSGMSPGNRAFCMGNALVVGVVHRIGQALSEIYL